VYRNNWKISRSVLSCEQLESRVNLSAAHQAAPTVYFPHHAVANTHVVHAAQPTAATSTSGYHHYSGTFPTTGTAGNFSWNFEKSAGSLEVSLVGKRASLSLTFQTTGENSMTITGSFNTYLREGTISETVTDNGNGTVNISGTVGNVTISQTNVPVSSFGFSVVQAPPSYTLYSRYTSCTITNDGGGTVTIQGNEKWSDLNETITVNKTNHTVTVSGTRNDKSETRTYSGTGSQFLDAVKQQVQLILSKLKSADGPIKNANQTRIELRQAKSLAIEQSLILRGYPVSPMMTVLLNRNHYYPIGTSLLINRVLSAT